MLKKTILLIAFCLFYSACSPSNLESLAQQNKRFNQQLTWNDLNAIQSFFTKSKRSQLSLYMTQYFQTNKIIDVATLGIDKNAENNTATVLLNVQWHALNQVNIVQSQWEAYWEYNSTRKNWFLNGLKKI